jgi:uncharacterized protein (TIGR00369 family)
MQPRNPDYARVTRWILSEAPFIRDLGVELVDFSPGRCETMLMVTERHQQHDGYVHAGVQATLADHTAGAAAATLMAADRMVLTAEFKLNLLRPGRGPRLYCIGQVLKPGNRLTVAEAEVYDEIDETRSLIAKATVTLAVIKRPAPG